MPGPTDPKVRKAAPMARGFLDYFPDAVAAVARHSLLANEKHNPGEELRWSKEKSSDHADCVLRHLADRGLPDPEFGESHTVALAWRAMALLQIEIDDAGGFDAWMAHYEDPAKAALRELEEEFDRAISTGEKVRQAIGRI